MPNSLQHLQIIPTGGALGAEIKGVDVSQPFPPDVSMAIRRGLMDHGVLYFRDQQISDEDQVRFTRYFGEPIPHVRKQQDRRVKEIFIISNVKENGESIGALGNADISFHSDLSYMPKPGTLSTLYAIELPRTGGETQWINCYTAYENPGGRFTCGAPSLCRKPEPTGAGGPSRSTHPSGNRAPISLRRPSPDQIYRRLARRGKRQIVRDTVCSCDATPVHLDA